MTATTDALPPWPSLQQAAEWTGLSEKTLRRYISEGLLKGAKIGPKLIRVERESLLALWKPIGLPSLDVGAGIDSAAVSLFIERAQAVSPGFSVANADEAAAVVEICRRLVRRRVLVAVWVQADVTAWRAWLGMLVGRDWMAGVVDLLAMIVSTRRSSWHLIRVPFLGCVVVVASCSAHIASETAAALLVRSASLRTGRCRSELRCQRGCQRCGRPQRHIRHQGRRPTKALI
jgi:excisionase family DNA binding protein